MFAGTMINYPQPIQPLYSVVTPPAALSIDLNTVKDFIDRPLEDTHWDAEITRFIKIAEKAIEAKAQITLSTTQWVATLPCFFDRILIKKRPFVSVDKIEYVDPTTGVVTTVDPTIYVGLPATQLCGMIYLGDGCAWPTPARRQDAVRITLTSGYGTSPSPVLPDDLSHVILMTTAAIDSNRGDHLGGSGGRQSVYEMKNNTTKGATALSSEAMALLAPYILRTV